MSSLHRWPAPYTMMQDGHHPGQSACHSAHQMLSTHPQLMHAHPPPAARPQPPPGQLVAMQGGTQGVLSPQAVYGYPPHHHMAVQMQPIGPNVPSGSALGAMPVPGPSGAHAAHAAHAGGLMLPTGPVVAPPHAAARGAVVQPQPQQAMQHPHVQQSLQQHPHMPPVAVQMMPVEQRAPSLLPAPIPSQLMGAGHAPMMHLLWPPNMQRPE